MSKIWFQDPKIYLRSKMICYISRETDLKLNLFLPQSIFHLVEMKEITWSGCRNWQSFCSSPLKLQSYVLDTLYSHCILMSNFDMLTTLTIKRYLSWVGSLMIYQKIRSGKGSSTSYALKWLFTKMHRNLMSSQSIWSFESLVMHWNGFSPKCTIML